MQRCFRDLFRFEISKEVLLTPLARRLATAWPALSKHGQHLQLYFDRVREAAQVQYQTKRRSSSQPVEEIFEPRMLARLIEAVRTRFELFGYHAPQNLQAVPADWPAIDLPPLVGGACDKKTPELVKVIVHVQLWGEGKAVPAFEAVAPVEPAPREPKGPPAPPSLPSNITSLKFGAGTWKPGQGGGKQPPLTATGVAPWAFKGGNGAQPPETPAPPKAPESGSLGSLREEEEAPKSGLERVHMYMKLLVPVKPIEGPNSWETALMEETPTLLPSLKFHNLVFGPEDIGHGAFSVVRYARTIQKEKTQSKWPEYAVKVINTKTMEDLGYEASVNREICVLKMLSHPGIARMVAAFRYRDGAYLVLEYAHKGDLHNMLCEVIAALCAIHDTGFVYSDLKPENVVITSSNHAKLTDFGGCRPVTDEAATNCRRALLKRLRDGDWRAEERSRAKQSEAGRSWAKKINLTFLFDAPEVQLSECEEEIIDDGRVEGTMIYLPPEVVKGGTPSFASDAWALGCLLYQLLTGRPPVWADSELEEEIRSRIVSFQLDDGADVLLGPYPNADVRNFQSLQIRASSTENYDSFETFAVESPA
eukprot:g450.t1